MKKYFLSYLPGNNVLPDGRLVVMTNYEYGEVIFLDSITGECLNRFGPIRKFSSALMLRNGNICIFAWDTIQIWSKQTGKLSKTLTGHNHCIEAWIELSDGRLVTSSGGDDPAMKIWDLHNGKCLKTIESVRCMPPFFEVSHDLLVGHTGSAPMSVVIWNIKTWKRSKTLAVGEAGVIELLDNIVVCGTTEGQLKSFSLHSGKCLQTFKGHTQAVAQILSLSDERIASRSYNSIIKIWNSQTGHCLETLTFSTPYCQMNKVSDRHLASSYQQKDDVFKIMLSDINTGNCLQTVTCHNYSQIWVMPDGRALIEIVTKDEIKLWNLLTLNKMLELANKQKILEEQEALHIRYKMICLRHC